MKNKKILADYYEGKIEIEVPANAQVVEWTDPEHIQDISEDDIRQAVLNPIGIAPIRKLLNKDSKVLIAFDDWARPPFVKQRTLPIVLEEIEKAGVKDDNIKLVFAGGLHRKLRPAEMKTQVGSDIFQRFYTRGRLLSHDCHDYNNLTSLGYAPGGGVVEVNNALVESDLTIYISHILPRHFGGYTGKGAYIGLSSARGVMESHNNEWLNLGGGHSDPHRHLFRQRKDILHKHIETAIGKKIFYINVMTKPVEKITKVICGDSDEIQETCWDFLDSYVLKDVEPADILIMGQPKQFTYGFTDNPLVAACGLGLVVANWVNKPVLNPGGIVIGLCGGKGRIDHNNNPSYQEAFDIWTDCHTPDQLEDYIEDFLNRQSYIHKYRYAYGHAPTHPFGLLLTLDYMYRRASRTVVVGVEKPGQYRKLGLTPVANFEDAIKMSYDLKGKDAKILVAPTYLSKFIFKFNVN